MIVRKIAVFHPRTSLKYLKKLGRVCPSLVPARTFRSNSAPITAVKPIWNLRFVSWRSACSTGIIHVSKNGAVPTQP